MSRPGVFTGIVIPIGLSLVPGWGHIWVKRPMRGLILFALFFAALNYGLLAENDPTDKKPLIDPTLAYGIAVGGFVFSIVDTTRVTLWLRSKTVQGRRSALFRKMVTHYLRNEYGQADEAVSKMLRIDPDDAGLIFWKGMLQRDVGQRRRAMKSFKRSLATDVDDYWTCDEYARERGYPNGKSKK